MLSKYALIYLAVLFTYLILDAIWLGLVAKSSYQEAIGPLMRAEGYPILPWVLFYVTYSFAIVYLVIHPNMGAASPVPVILSAAVLGIAAYGAYNLTNYAILKDWPLGITLKDWAWGTFITTASSVAGFYAAKHLHAS